MHEPHYGMNRRTIDGRPHTGCYQEFPKGLAVAHELGVAGDLQQVVLQRTSERASERARARARERGGVQRGTTQSKYKDSSAVVALVALVTI